MDHRILCLSAEDVGQSLTMSECIEAMRDAFMQLSSGQAKVPLRTALQMPPENGNALFMPVYLPNQRTLGVKAVTIHKDNPVHGLPMIHAVVMMFDAANGVPLAIMDGELLTAMRTGAVSGLATDLLARENSEIVAIIGTGVQGETQLEAVCTVRDIKKAIVFDISRKRAEAYAYKMAGKCGIEIAVAESPDLIKEADIICTATSSHKPVFEDKLLGNGVHINGVGSYRPDMCEIPSETVARAKVVVDEKKACLSEAGDLVQPMAQGMISQGHIHGELGDILLVKKPARENGTEITLFKSVGVAVQDLAAANIVLKHAREQGLGTKITL